MLVKNIVTQTGRQQRFLVAWLHAIQESVGYIPQEALELLVQDAHWPLPKYREMLFVY